MTIYLPWVNAILHSVLNIKRQTSLRVVSSSTPRPGPSSSSHHRRTSYGRPVPRWPRCGCRCGSWRPRWRGARLRWRRRGGSTGRGWRGWRPPSRRTSRPASSCGSPCTPGDQNSRLNISGQNFILWQGDEQGSDGHQRPVGAGGRQTEVSRYPSIIPSPHLVLPL